MRNPPDDLVKIISKTGTKNRQNRCNTACHSRIIANVQEDASQLVLTKNKTQGHRNKRKSSVLAAPPVNVSMNHDINLFAIAGDRLAVVPFSPRYYCKELADEDHELLVVELQAAKNAGRQAWLEDENLAVVLVCTLNGMFLVSRLDLRTYVKKVVPLAKPIRNLNKALYKICTPLGVEGPTVTLLPSQKVLREIDHSSYDEWEDKVGVGDIALKPCLHVFS